MFGRAAIRLGIGPHSSSKWKTVNAGTCQSQPAVIHPWHWRWWRVWMTKVGPSFKFVIPCRPVTNLKLSFWVFGWFCEVMLLTKNYIFTYYNYRRNNQFFWNQYARMSQVHVAKPTDHISVSSGPLGLLLKLGSLTFPAKRDRRNQLGQELIRRWAVSYTHLTLPTILRV